MTMATVTMIAASLWFDIPVICVCLVLLYVAWRARNL